MNLANTDDPNQFILIKNEDWIPTDFPYETMSVMHYCSECGSNGDGPVMTFHDGSRFESGKFMTTTDSLQINTYYCKETGIHGPEPVLGPNCLVRCTYEAVSGSL